MLLLLRCFNVISFLVSSPSLLLYIHSSPVSIIHLLQPLSPQTLCKCKFVNTFLHCSSISVSLPSPFPPCAWWTLACGQWSVCVLWSGSVTTAWDKFICILGFPEIRNEMHRVTRNLKECQSLSQTYNQRERLFGMPVTQVRGVVTQVGAWSHRWGMWLHKYRVWSIGWGVWSCSWGHVHTGEEDYMYT